MKKVAIVIDQRVAPNEKTYSKILEFLDEKLMFNDWEHFSVEAGSAVNFLAAALQQALVIVGENSSKDKNIARALVETLKNIYGEEVGEKILISHPSFMPTDSSEKLCCIATLHKTCPGSAEEVNNALKAMGYDVISITLDNNFDSVVSDKSILVCDFEKSIDNINNLLKSANIFVDPKDELEELVSFFNERFSNWSKNNRFGANFEFSYEPETGAKKIKIKDCAELSSIPEDLKAIKIGAVEKVMEGLSSQV